MMNKLVVLVLLIAVVGCDRKPFVNHKVKLDRVSEYCHDKQDYFRITANIAGERFEFEKCLPFDYDKDLLTSERKGDTVVINFNQPHGKVNANEMVAYKATLDIDSYPKYSFITIDGETYMLAMSEK